MMKMGSGKGSFIFSPTLPHGRGWRRATFYWATLSELDIESLSSSPSNLDSDTYGISSKVENPMIGK